MIQSGFEKILVPVDGSKNSLKALEKAIYISQLSGAKITILHVISALPPIPITDTVIQYKGRMKEQAKKYFKEARQIASKNHIELDERIIFGYPDYDVSYFANDNKFDLVVMGSRGMSPIKELFLGSTSNATVHRSKIPVLVVK